MNAGDTRQKIQDYIAELRKRAAKSQDEAHRELNPLFDDRHQPRAFIESSFLYIRSCDVDNGSRALPCQVFWMSPDIRVMPLSTLGAHTNELRAGDAYRLATTVRNRGDLHVPAAKVEFYLVDPSLGFDTRYATKLGVASTRVDAYGVSEIALDWVVPPALSGHRCLFARVFSFSPLDLPLDDYALDPRIDRHVGQLNLHIVAASSTYSLDWIHLANAVETLELVPMSAAMLRAIRAEQVTALSLASRALWKEASGKVQFAAVPGEGAEVTITRTSRGLDLTQYESRSGVARTPARVDQSGAGGPCFTRAAG